MSMYLINRVDLGKRITGYEVYSSDTKEIIGLTEKQVKSLLTSGNALYGFTLDDNGELQLDRDGFHTKNYMIKTGIGRLKPFKESTSAVNVFYVLVSVQRGTESTTYEVVSSRFSRICITEEKLKALLEFGCLTGGCYLDREGKVVICDGVEITDGDQ